MSDRIEVTAGGTRVVHLDEIESTNSEAMRRAMRGEAGPLWVVADRQTGGRGRSGRAWVSPAGNLHASRLMALGCAPAVVPQLSLVAGIAVFESVRAVAAGGPDGLRLKWPNDVLVGGDKLSGILVESTTIGQQAIAVIGIGLNLTSHPEGLDYPATCLGRHHSTTDRRAVLDALDRAIDLWLNAWQEGRGSACIRSAWLERAGPIGEPVSVDTGGALLAGTFAGIDDDGALLLLDSDGSVSRHAYGGVTLRAGPPSSG